MLSSWLKFTPLEFETDNEQQEAKTKKTLKFTPLEFETFDLKREKFLLRALKFTPLEFETCSAIGSTWDPGG